MTHDLIEIVYERHQGREWRPVAVFLRRSDAEWYAEPNRCPAGFEREVRTADSIATVNRHHTTLRRTTR